MGRIGSPDTSVNNYQPMPGKTHKLEDLNTDVLSNGITVMSKFLKTSVDVLKLKHTNVLMGMTIHIRESSGTLRKQRIISVTGSCR